MIDFQKATTSLTNDIEEKMKMDIYKSLTGLESIDSEIGNKSYGEILKGNKEFNKYIEDFDDILKNAINNIKSKE